MKNRMLTKIAAMSVTAVMSLSVFTAIPGGIVLAEGDETQGEEQSNEEPTDPEPSAPTGLVIENGVATLYSDYETESPISDISVFDMNGYTLTYTGSIPLFLIENKSFEIKDSSTEKTGKISSVNGASIITTDDVDTDYKNETVILSGGTLEGNATGYDSTGNSAIGLFYGDKFTMNGGTICNFSSKNGGAIHSVESDVTLNAGKIEYCYSENGGAVWADHSNVYLQGTISMSYNSANKGGAIYFTEENARGCKLYVNGGYITNNTTSGAGSAGGGVYVYRNNIIDSLDHDFDDVYSVSVSGTPRIANNSDSGNKDNLYLAEGKDIIFVAQSDSLSGEPSIGLSRANSVVGNQIIDDCGSKRYSDKAFFSDDPNFSLLMDENHDFYFGEVIRLPEVKGCNLVLDGSFIGMKYKVFVPDSYSDEQIDNMRVDTYFRTKQDGIPTGIGYGESDIEPQNKVKVDGGYNVEFMVKAISTDMSAKIRFTLYDRPQSATGRQSIISDSTYSIAGYAETLLADPTTYNLTSKETGIIKAMLNYGTASQNKFNVNTNNPANACLDDKDKNTFKDLDTSTVTPRQLDQADPDHVKFYAASMVFEETIALKFYFKYSGVAPSDLTVTVNGESYTAKVSAPYIYIKISGIDINDIEDSYTVVVNDGTSDVVTLTYSPMNYIANIYSKNSTDAMGILVKSLYTYYKSMHSNEI